MYILFFRMVAIRLAYIAAILFPVSQATNESDLTSLLDYYSDGNNGNYYDNDYFSYDFYDYYNTFPPEPDCPCSYIESTHEAQCGFRHIEIVPDCIPDTVHTLEFKRNWLEYRPRQFERFKDLRKLGLSLNNFDRLGNDSFVGLSELQELDLSNEFRHHTLSMSLFGLIGSSLSWNHITEIRRDAFTGLSNLRRLDLRNNPIKLVDSFAFSVLNNLHELNLSNPWVTQAHPIHFSNQSFEGLSSLTYLGLENSDVFNVTSFPAGIFKPLTNLQHLNLQRFCRAPDLEEDNCPNLAEQIGSIPTLQYLYIDAERLTQLGPGFQSLKNLKEIEFLAVLDVHMKSLSSKTFENLENSPLTKIALKTSQTTHGQLMIDEVMPNTFASFKQLQVLDFTFVSNSESSCFGEMRNLATGLQNTTIKHLRISINHLICDNDANELPDLRGTKLEILDLSHSSIVSVSDDGGVAREFGDFFVKLPKSLKYLHLQHNKIHIVDLKYLHRLEQLQVLDMSYQNQWATLREKKSMRARNKRQSNTDGYEVEMDGSTAIGTNPEYVDYPYPYKFEPAECYTLPLSLETIDISYSGLFYGFSQTFCDANNMLKTLNLSNQNQYFNHDKLWKSLKSLLMLEDLNLNGNSIQNIPTDAFAKQEHLKTLSLAHNKLKTVGFEVGALANLKLLHLQDNNIQYAADKFMIQIETLAENQPTPAAELPDQSQDADILAKFNIYYYEYGSEMDGVAEQPSSLSVDLSENPLTCDCGTINFVKWLRDTSLIYNRWHDDTHTCTYKNGSLVWLEDISEIYAILQRDCKENVKSLSASEGNTESHDSSSMIILGTVLGIIILGLIIVILALIRRQRKLADRNGDDSIVLT